MKKIAAIILLFLTFAVSVNAELNEVRGILTKQEVRGEVYYFIFTNENSYPVWLDMEVYYKDSSGYSSKFTKSITLQAGETYEWKPGLYESTYRSECYTKYKAYKKQ